MADLDEPGVGEDAAAADMQLAPGDLLAGLGDHRIGLERTSAALARERDGGGHERASDPATPVARACREAGHGPDAVVVLVLTPLPQRETLARQTRVGCARLDRAPPDGLAGQVPDEAAGRLRRGIPTRRLRTQAESADFDGRVGPRVVPDLEHLALAVGCVTARAEDGLQVLPRCFVGGHDHEGLVKDGDKVVGYAHRAGLSPESM